MLSAFSAAAPKRLKAYWAFRIYDFNGDGVICRDDIRHVVQTMCGAEKYWADDDLKRVVDGFFREADMDEDMELAFDEFENVVEKSPDFVGSFQFRL